jgi:hypothetical protein
MPTRTAGLLLAAAALVAADQPYPPAPGHAGLPVVFWSHYMPQVGTAQLDANGHAHGGTDCHPFVAQGSGLAQSVAHIRYALDAGINGFQMLGWPDPAMYEAARTVQAAGGGMFYVNPQWCDQKDYDKAVAQMGDFALAHKDDPHVFRIGGKQVHFFYSVNWARSDDDERIEQARAAIRARGVEVLLMPGDGSRSVRPADMLLLDRTDLDHRPWPAFARPEPGPLSYLASTRWDGCDAWGPRDMPDHLMGMLVERLRPHAGRYLFIPAVAPGYDSSNRARQAIHCPHRGVGILRDGLRQAVRNGFRQVDCVTWNDVNETMLLPSTRSPFGMSEVIRFWRGLAEDGRSPFDTARVVVAYDPEVLYGDELPFQAVVMPERGALSADYQVRVRFEDEHGVEVAASSLRLAVPDERTDAVGEARLDTTAFAGWVEVLSPVVEVLRYDLGTSKRQVLHQRLRLPPITLRANKVQFFTSYVVALSRVAPDLAVELTAAGSRTLAAPAGAVLPLRIAHRGSEPLRRLTLAESRLSRGAVRADDTAEGLAGRQRGFLRLRSERALPVTVRIADGVLHERTAHHWDLKRMVVPVGAAEWTGLSLPLAKPGEGPWHGMQNAIGALVLRASWGAAGRLAVLVGSDKTPLFDLPIAELAAGPVTRVAQIDGAPAALRLEWVLDAVEANLDYPLPATGDGLRLLPVSRYEDETRYLHAWALTTGDRVAYSRPLVVRRAAPGQADATVALPLIRTGGTFEDPVSSSSSAARNPYAAADVVVATVPARLIPYIRIDADEAGGAALNDGGTAHQVGRAWLNGAVERIADGWRGGALRFRGGEVQLRAKSMPHGAYTFSARLRAPRPAAPAVIARDGDFWQGVGTDALRVTLQPDGRIAATRKVGESAGAAVADAAIHEGWNHVAVTYDLAAVRVWLDGRLAGEGRMSAPGYQRTHSCPTIGFLPAAATPAGATAPELGGDLDQIEIIGTALDAASIAELARRGHWRER